MLARSCHPSSVVQAAGITHAGARLVAKSGSDLRHSFPQHACTPVMKLGSASNRFASSASTANRSSCDRTKEDGQTKMGGASVS